MAEGVEMERRESEGEFDSVIRESSSATALEMKKRGRAT